MTPKIDTTDLAFATGNLPASELAALTDPASDPALVLPAFATEEADCHEPAGEIPSVDDIEAALLAHVRGESAPREMIFELLSPFKGFLDLRPGKGQKRPSYELRMDDYGLIIHRAPLREVAETLHGIAQEISRYRVGDRAPSDAPFFTLKFPWGSCTNTTIKAPNIQAAHLACRAISGRRPSETHVQLPFGAQDVVPHVLAARELIHRSVTGEPGYREQAMALIRAVQDLRSCATVILRRNPQLRRFSRYWITLSLGEAGDIKICDGTAEDMTAHEQIEFAGVHHELTTTMKAVMEHHSVLRELPSTYQIEMSGEPHYLDVQLENTALPAGDINRKSSSSLFEYSMLTELADQLGRLDNRVKPARATWILQLGYRARSNTTWHLSGPTLANAIAKEIDVTESRASMQLIDLLIDLLAGEDEGSVGLYRVLD